LGVQARRQQRHESRTNQYNITVHRKYNAIRPEKLHI